MGLLDARKIKQNENYLISPEGDVISLERKYEGKRSKGKKTKSRILKKSIQANGYEKVVLRKNGKKINYLVHRLVGEAFILNPENKPEINHDNGIRNDNRVENLIWSSSSENQKHSFRVLGRINPRTRKIKQFKDGILIKEWPSIKSAEISGQGFKNQSIGKVCLGKAKSHRGFQWEYAD